MKLPHAPASITRDIITLLNEIGAAYSNYLTNAHRIFENAGKPFVEDRVSKMKEQMSERAQQLIRLAEEAHASGLAIQAFVEARQPLEFAQIPRKREEATPILSFSRPDWKFPVRYHYAVYYALGAVASFLFLLVALNRKPKQNRRIAAGRVRNRSPSPDSP